MNGRFIAGGLWLAGLGFGGLFLALTATRTDVGALAGAFASLSWPAVGVAMLAYALGLVCRAWRWRELLAPIRALDVGRMLRPTLVGHALNNLFPARLGELFRANYARGVCAVRGSTLLGTIVVERLLDLALVLALLAAGVAGLSAGSAESHRAIGIGAAILLTASLMLVLLAVLAPRLRALPVVGERLELFRQGVASLGRVRGARVLGLTVAVWTLEAMALWLLFSALHTPLSAAGVGLVLACGALSTLLPNAPGFVGTLQFAFMTATGLLGLDGTAGIAAATLVQLCLYLPTTVAGLTWAAWSRESPFRYDSLATLEPPEAR